MSIKSAWKKLTPTEKLFLGMILILLIMIALRWESISKGVSGSFKKFFEKHSSI